MIKLSALSDHIFRQMELKRRNGLESTGKNLYNYSESRRKRLSLIAVS